MLCLGQSATRRLVNLNRAATGSAPLPNADEIRRLRIVQQSYRADRVVLFQWIKGMTAMFSTLGDDGEWHETTASALFGRKS